MSGDKKTKVASATNAKASTKEVIDQICDSDVPIEAVEEESSDSRKRGFDESKEVVVQRGQSSTGLSEEEQAELFFNEQSKRRVTVPVAVVAVHVPVSNVQHANPVEQKRVVATMSVLMFNSLAIGLTISNAGIIQSFLKGTNYSCMAVV
jgi:hypothetical protein